MKAVTNPFVILAAGLILIGTAAVLFAQQSASVPLRFVLLGDRTGETVPGIYESVWREVAAAKPAFVVGAGDSIQGLDDKTAEAEWQEFDHLLNPLHAIPFYPAAGNHDVWSDASAKLFTAHTGHPLHYGFDNGPAHFTVLDNSRTDDLQPDELAFIESDLKAHESQPVKFIVSHRPSWLLNVILRNPGFPLARLAKQYGVHYVIAGHVHEMMHATLDGIEYVSVPSAGGHLRNSNKYDDGWFFGYIVVTVDGKNANFEVHELGPPNGEARITPLSAWGAAGLLDKPKVN